jgi:dihydrofolate synthase/folylpolyglutamate synthase
MTYTEAIQFLYELRLFGAKFGLENSIKLAELAGHPHRQLRFIHVAGTNGKGSTCAMLESIYRTAGLRVGLFTSPHLVSFAERIQVNRQWIRPQDVVRLVQALRPLLKEFPEGHHSTFFEVVMVMALQHFAEQKCDLVIWETGLGGRLDATNIVGPLASVITNIGIDHSEWLGETIEKIAREKAGIIKPGVPVVTAARPGEGLEVIAAVAQEKRAPLTIVDSAAIQHTLPPDASLALSGLYQRTNAATALAAVRVLQDQVSVPDTAIRAGLSRVDWPGRMQIVRRKSGVILLDGAHNTAGAEALRTALRQDYTNSQLTLIFGVFRDKDSAAMIHVLAPLAGRIVLTRVQSDRSEDPEKVAGSARAANPAARVQIAGSLSDALAQTADDPFVVVAGSLYLIGEATELLHLANAADEKALNEWSGTCPSKP